MTKDEIQRAFSDSVGVILTYLDEAGTGSAVKRAVKEEMYHLCDDKIMPMADKQEQEGDDNGDRFNR